MLPAVARAWRDNALRLERAEGATIRRLAARYGLSKSRVHVIVRTIEIRPPAPRLVVQTVHPPEGGCYAQAAFVPGPKPRGYTLRHGRRAPC